MFILTQNLFHFSLYFFSFFCTLSLYEMCFWKSPPIISIMRSDLIKKQAAKHALSRRAELSLTSSLIVSSLSCGGNWRKHILQHSPWGCSRPQKVEIVTPHIFQEETQKENLSIRSIIIHVPYTNNKTIPIAACTCVYPVAIYQEVFQPLFYLTQHTVWRCTLLVCMALGGNRLGGSL